MRRCQERLHHQQKQPLQILPLGGGVPGFPGNSAGKESAWYSGDPGLIPELGRSPGEGIGYPLQYFWAPLVAQMVKNPPAMQETWVQSLGWEDPLEEDMATYSRVLAWRIPMDRGAWQATVHGGHKESDTAERLSTAQKCPLVETLWVSS